MYKNFKEQFDILFRNVVEAIKLYPSIEDSTLEFNTPITLTEGLYVISVNKYMVQVKDGTFTPTENWDYNDFSLRELLKVLEQLEAKNYD